MNAQPRSSTLSLGANGARGMLQLRLLLLWLLALLLPTAIAALPLARLLGDRFDYAVLSPHWATHFDGIALAALLELYSGGTATPFHRAELLGALFSLLFSPLLPRPVFGPGPGLNGPGF